MEEWIEIEGKTRQEAIERACNALNTTEAYLEVEVLGGKGGKIRARKIEKPNAAMLQPRDEEIPEEEIEEPPMREDAVVEEPEEEVEAAPAREKPAPRPPPREIPPEVVEKARESLEGIVRFIDGEAKVEVRHMEEKIRLEILGNGSGLLIGKYGQTLDALQHLVLKMIGLERGEGVRLEVDSAGYRERREESLASLAQRLAERVRRVGRPQGTEPMNAMDRRVIHLTLADDPDVMTKSVGEGQNRKVMIVLRDGARRGGDRDRGPPQRRGPPGRDRPMNRGGRRGPGDSRRQGPRAPDREASPPRRRAGPPPRQHDSFDVPSAPDLEMLHEDPDAPLIGETKTEPSSEE